MKGIVKIRLDHTEYDEDLQFHLISIRKIHDGAINLFPKSKDRSILACETRVADVRVYPSNHYRNVPLKNKN